MTFDALYGAGSWAQFQGLFPAGGGGVSMTLRQVDIPNGVLVIADYQKGGGRVGQVKAAHYADHVDWLSHTAPRSGHLSDMIDLLAPFYRARGCRYMWMGTRDGAITPQHEAVGFVLQPNGKALLDLGV